MISLPKKDDFLLNLQTNNFSGETVYNYERDLMVFENFLDHEMKLFDFDAITKQTILHFKAFLISKDRLTADKAKGLKLLSGGSINRCLSSIRGYFKYLIEMDYDVPIPPEAIKLVKTEKKHAKVAELNDLIRLVEAPVTLEKNKKIGLRNRTMLEVLFSTGMRISELVNLRRQQIDDSGKIFILGKGKKERFVYLTPRAMKQLNEYFRLWRDESVYLFYPLRGLNASVRNKKISTNYLQERIKFYREILKINVPTSAHSLRHGFATYLAEKGANPAAIQILLGHESLDTTTRYVHASDKFAEKTHKEFHPLSEGK